MSLCRYSTDSLGVDCVLSLADQALCSGHFAQAESLFAKAIAIDATPLSRLRLGRCQRYQGRHHAALDILHETWEQSKRLGCRNFRAEACFALSQTYRELDQRSLEDQYRQLGIAAAVASVSAGSSQSLEFEFRLSRSREKHQRTTYLTDSSILKELAEFSHDVHQRSQALFDLQQAIASCPSQISSLMECIICFRQAGNLYGAMIAYENLARLQLSRKTWRAGLAGLRSAQQIAEVLNLPNKERIYRNLLARLCRALSLRISEPGLN